ncbi:MAG: tetratricopeptide repeat protein [bacterium]
MRDKSKVKAKKTPNIILPIVVIILSVLIVFLPSLQNGFTNWDDNVLVTENMTIRELSWHNIGHYFTSYYISTYIPLTLLSFALEYQVADLNPLLFHMTNLAIHIINCLLVFFMIFLLTKNIGISLITALLFGLHPLRVESVAWVTERKDVLFSLFFLGALIFYLFYQKTAKVRDYCISIIMFILSALSKGMAVALPLVVLLFDYYLKRRFNKKLIFEKIPYFLIALAFGLLAVFAQFPSIARRVEPLVTFPGTIFIACCNILFYLLKLVLPVRLSAIYPYPNLSGSTLPMIFYVSPLIVIGLIILASYVGKRSRKILFGSAFFLFNIVTVIGIIPLAGDAIAADRYTYIPSIGISFLIAAGFYYLYKKKSIDLKFHKHILLLILISVLAIFSILTWQRCKVWKNDMTLWEDALSKYPSPVAFNNRGLAFYEKKQYEKAIKDFNNALDMDSEYSTAYYNRANAYDAKVDYHRAIADYSKAIGLNPKAAKAYNNRGLTYGRVDQYQRAIDDFTEAVRIDPTYALAFNNRGMIYGRLEQHKQAVADFTEAVRIAPDYAKGYYNRAIAYYSIGEYKKALEDVIKSRALGYEVNPGLIQRLEYMMDNQ